MILNPFFVKTCEYFKCQKSWKKFQVADCRTQYVVSKSNSILPICKTFLLLHKLIFIVLSLNPRPQLCKESTYDFQALNMTFGWA